MSVFETFKGMIPIILGLLLGRATAELVHVSIAEEVIEPLTPQLFNDHLQTQYFPNSIQIYFT